MDVNELCKFYNIKSFVLYKLRILFVRLAQKYVLYIV